MAALFAVNKNIPFPKTIRTGVKTPRKYPYETMEVGDCFFIPGKARNTLSTHNSNVGKKLGRKFRAKVCYMRKDEDGAWELCEATDTGAVLGLGVWRFPDPTPAAPADDEDDDDSDSDVVEDDEEDDD